MSVIFQQTKSYIPSHINMISSSSVKIDVIIMKYNVEILEVRNHFNTMTTKKRASLEKDLIRRYLN